MGNKALKKDRYPIETEFRYKGEESFGSFVSKGSLRILQLRKIFSKIVEKKKEDPIPNETSIPRAFYHEFDIHCMQIQNRNLFQFRPMGKECAKTVFYIHGGAFIYNMNVGQFHLLTQLMRNIDIEIIVPDYPLVPHGSVLDALSMIRESFEKTAQRVGAENIVVMGDAAGGCLALALCEQMRNEKYPLPSSIILLSPWLDITMSNPEIEDFDEHEMVLDRKGIRELGQIFADDLPGDDYRISPLRGELDDLPEINIFTGTHDILHPDAKELKNRLKEGSRPYRYFEYPKMMHGFIEMPHLRESRFAINQIIFLLKSEFDR